MVGGEGHNSWKVCAGTYFRNKPLDPSTFDLSFSLCLLENSIENQENMPLLTVLSRISDGLLLAEDMKVETAAAGHRAQAIQLLAKVNERSPEQMSLNAGNFYFL